MRLKTLRSIIVFAAAAILAVSSALATEFGPAKGALVIVGGAMKDPAILKKFFELAGGVDQPIVVIPAAP